jgi:hypothetical protein
MKNIVIIIGIFLISILSTKADWGLYGSLVTTGAISNITRTDAECISTVTLLEGDPAVTEKGIVWKTSANPTLLSNNGFTEEGAGPSDDTPTNYTSYLTGLNHSTLYYVNAYAINDDGTYYGNQITFSTVPTLPEWGLIALISLSGIIGGWFVWKKYV